MPDERSWSAVMPSTSPAEAYAADLERLGRSTPIGGSDDAWLVLAHALHRFSLLTEAEANAALSQTADAIAINAVAAGVATQSALLRCALALQAMHDASRVLESGHSPVTELFVATQAVAEEQELAGAFELAHATLHGVLRAFGNRATPRAQGNVMAQLGRAVRQLGAHDLAHGYYDEAIMVGYECEALDVVARALLGLGVMALTRGNYPKARELFERALVNADRANDPELIRSAHHGLFNCALASGDLDSALVHGWNVLRLCIAPDSRAEALVNMAEVCRLTGEHDAALRVYSVAMEWTSQPRVRAHALGGALQSAVACHRSTDVRRYLKELDELMPSVPDPYTRAVVAVERSNAMIFLGDAGSATVQLEEALSLATAHSYHELVHRVEQLTAGRLGTFNVERHESPGTRRSRPRRSDEFRMVLRSLKGLATAGL